MLKKIGVLIVTILGGALLVYSATRSLDFIELTLPADRKILAYFGLAALDGGVIAWLLSYMYGSRGGWQRAISVLMLIVDVIGAIAMFTLDTMYQTGKAGLTEAMTPEELTNAVLALSAVIALNIIATIAHHVTEPEKMREMAEEESFSKVEEAALKQISKNADALAARLAPTMAADWMQQTEARYMAYLGTGKMPPIDVTPPNVPRVPFVLPPLDNENKQSGLWQFIPAWLNPKLAARKFEAAAASQVNDLEIKPKSEMFVYKCPDCGWVTKSPEMFTDKKPCMNCSGFVELQSNEGGGLYGAMKQGIAEAQGVKPEDLYSAGDGVARVLSQEPTYHPVGYQPMNTGGDKAEAIPAPFEDNEPKPE